MGLGGAQPEGQLGYLHALLVDVNTVEVVFQDAVLHILELDGIARHLGFHLVNQPVLVHQEAEGCIEEGTATAGRVKDGDSEEPVAVVLQLVEQALLGLQLAALVAEVFFLADAHLLFLLRAEPPHGVLHDVFRDVLRGVEHTVLLALGSGGSLAAGYLLRHLLNLRE